MDDREVSVMLRNGSLLKAFFERDSLHFIKSIEKRYGVERSERAKSILRVAYQHAESHRNVAEYYRSLLAERMRISKSQCQTDFLNSLNYNLTSTRGFLANDFMTLCSAERGLSVPNINLILTASSGGLGDILGISFLASALSRIFPDSHLRLLFFSRGDYERSIELLPSIQSEVEVTHSSAALSAPLLRENLNIFYTAPWNYGRGSAPTALGNINLLIRDYTWPIGESALYIDQDGRMFAILQTGFRFDSAGIHLNEDSDFYCSKGSDSMDKVCWLQDIAADKGIPYSRISFLKDFQWGGGYLSVLSLALDFLVLIRKSVRNTSPHSRKRIVFLFFCDNELVKQQDDVARSGLITPIEEVTLDSVEEDDQRLQFINIGQVPNQTLKNLMKLADMPVLVTGNLTLVEAIQNEIPFIYVPIISENVMTSLSLRLHALNGLQKPSHSYAIDDVLSAICVPWNYCGSHKSLDTLGNALVNTEYSQASSHFIDVLKKIPSLYSTVAQVIQCLCALRSSCGKSENVAWGKMQAVYKVPSFKSLMKISKGCHICDEEKLKIINEWNSLRGSEYRRMFLDWYGYPDLPAFCNE